MVGVFFCECEGGGSTKEYVACFDSMTHARAGCLTLRRSDDTLNDEACEAMVEFHEAKGRGRESEI